MLGIEVKSAVRTEDGLSAIQHLHLSIYTIPYSTMMAIVPVGFLKLHYFSEGHVVKKRVSAKAEVSLDERLLSAAMDVFLERGFAAATVDEIAARAKASKLTFYKHYGNKEALFEAVVKRQNAALLVETIGRAVPEGMPLDRFLEATANRLHAALLKPETVRLMRVLHVEAEHFPQFADIFNNAGPARGTLLIAAELEKNMTRGTMRRADPVLAAEHFLHLALGELTRRILLGLRPTATKAEVSRRIAAGIDVFLRAYGISSRK